MADAASPKPKETDSKPKAAEGPKPVPLPPKIKPSDAPKAGADASKGKPVDVAKAKAASDEPIGWIGTPLALGEISILLDTYDDIFSDFDPRPYGQRELSDDFLKELQRRYREKRSGGFEVRFLIPPAMREPRHEAIIKKRLREHFASELHEMESQQERRRERGLRNLLMGLFLLGGETALVLKYPGSLGVQLASLLLVPGGWFFVWTGMDRLLDEPAATGAQRSFYEKFIKCDYVFVTQDLD